MAHRDRVPQQEPPLDPRPDEGKRERAVWFDTIHFIFWVRRRGLPGDLAFLVSTSGRRISEIDHRDHIASGRPRARMGKPS
jgi:hypothetical protein